MKDGEIDMVGIKKISFAHTGRMEGCTCDRCGQWITNIWTVDTTDSLRQSYGIDCFEKMFKSGNLTTAGVKKFKALLKGIERYETQLEMWTTITEEEAREKGLLVDLTDADWNNSYWAGKQFSEYRDWMVNDFYPARLAECENELKKFEKARFNK